MKKTEKVVVFLEDDVQLAETYENLVTSLTKAEVVITHSLEEMKVLSDKILSSDIAFLDINLGANQPSGIDALKWLNSQKYEGRVFFFTGHATTHPEVRKALMLENIQILTKPTPIDRLLEIINDEKK